MVNKIDHCISSKIAPECFRNKVDEIMLTPYSLDLLHSKNILKIIEINKNS